MCAEIVTTNYHCSNTFKNNNKKSSTPLFIIASLSPLKFHHSTINTASKCHHIIVRTCHQGAHMLIIQNMDTQSHLMSLPTHLNMTPKKKKKS